MDVRRDGGRQILGGQLVADLSLAGAQPDRRRTGADGIAGGDLRLAGQGDREGAAA